MCFLLRGSADRLPAQQGGCGKGYRRVSSSIRFLVGPSSLPQVLGCKVPYATPRPEHHGAIAVLQFCMNNLMYMHVYIDIHVYIYIYMCADAEQFPCWAIGVGADLRFCSQEFAIHPQMRRDFIHRTSSRHGEGIRLHGSSLAVLLHRESEVFQVSTWAPLPTHC